MTTTPLQSNLKLGAYPTAASCARLHAKSVAWEWGLSELAETVELVVSELTTNGVKAAAALQDPDEVMGVPVRVGASHAGSAAGARRGVGQ